MAVGEARVSRIVQKGFHGLEPHGVFQQVHVGLSVFFRTDSCRNMYYVVVRILEGENQDDPIPGTLQMSGVHGVYLVEE